MDAFLKRSSQAKSAGSSSSKPVPSSGKAESRPVPWVEKYRPKAVEDVTQQEEVVAVLKSTLRGADLPNLLFYGPPGTGKTSSILAIARQLYGPELMKSRVLELNASDERGIQVVRDKVKRFAQLAVSATTADGKQCPPFKIIILDEADSMTTSAQAALRRTMEKQSKTTRFCLICNYISRIIEPLTSRCTKFRFKPLSAEVVICRLEYIASEEGVKCAPGVIARIMEVSAGDLRKAITFLQSAASLKRGEGVTEGDIREIAGVVPGPLVASLLGVCSSLSYEGLDRAVRELILEGYSASQVLTQLHDHLVREEGISDRSKSAIAERMGVVDRCLMDGADEYLQLMDLCTVIMNHMHHAH